ncbi:MAG TPA: hypothetical protein VFE50_15255 [Cyclobacteriaceae bacterium]|nr:hypothetical protein [Cyclobacteriaceae bacterium]
MSSTIQERINSIDKYLSEKGYESYDPYDGLASPLVHWITSRNQFVARVWQQAVRLLPINIRPLLFIPKMIHTKAVSDLASAYCVLQNEKKAREMLDLLLSIQLPVKNGMGWGLRFPFATRFVHAGKMQANIFQTINAMHAFLDGYETFHDPKYLEPVRQGFLFLEKDLGYVETDTTLRWKYWEGLEVEILNVSGLLIGLTARMAVNTGEEIYRTRSKKLFNYIKANQNADGSWYYSVDSRGHFIDGFHTGYILEGIIRAVQCGTIEIDDSVKKGIAYYLDTFFTEDQTPRYFHNSTYPIDGQNLAQALQTLHFILNVNFVAEKRVFTCFERVDTLLWNAKGYYNYKKSRWLTYKTPMHRWVTGPIFLALALLRRSEQREGRAYLRNDTDGRKNIRP